MFPTNAYSQEATVTLCHDDAGICSLEVDRNPLVEEYIVATPPAGCTDPLEACRALRENLEDWLAGRPMRIVQARLFGASRHEDRIRTEWASLTSRDPSWKGCTPLWVGQRHDPGVPLSGAYVVAVEGSEVALRRGPEGCGIATYASDGVRSIWVGGLVGPAAAPSAREAAEGMFRDARAALEFVGARMTDIARTWIYLGDILGWYGDFNAVRTGAYREAGIAAPGGPALPASTGIAGFPSGGAHVAMDLHALVSESGAVTVEPVCSSAQPEAASYGSRFSRATAISYAGAETLHISGTAAIGPDGESLCSDDLVGQIDRTLEAVTALLDERSMELSDFLPTTVFVKPGRSADTVRQVLRERLPHARAPLVFAADICRPELLFEVDGIAARALSNGGGDGDLGSD